MERVRGLSPSINHVRQEETKVSQQLSNSGKDSFGEIDAQTKKLIL